MEPKDFYERFIFNDFESSYVPHKFETICRQYLINLNREGKNDEPFEKIGKYWYDDPVTRSNGEFDFVTLNAKGYIFYEAKFRKVPVTQKMIDEEIRQVEKTGLNCYRYGFMSASGFEDISGENMILKDLDDLYE